MEIHVWGTEKGSYFLPVTGGQHISSQLDTQVKFLRPQPSTPGTTVSGTGNPFDGP